MTPGVPLGVVFAPVLRWDTSELAATFIMGQKSADQRCVSRLRPLARRTCDCVRSPARLHSPFGFSFFFFFNYLQPHPRLHFCDGVLNPVSAVQGRVWSKRVGAERSFTGSAFFAKEFQIFAATKIFYMVHIRSLATRDTTLDLIG